MIGDEERWRRYIIDALIETTISRDILLLSRVDKPALLRRLFHLACEYSGQIRSYAFSPRRAPLRACGCTLGPRAPLAGRPL